ncbi:hypothetical protein LTR78_006305 [Recurvomyces mirabilis]|uniref:Histone chaperone RTT106/FACT complex subunit SPT16-like middle domain-containing protein n=1 Tax=Recurvomyces mirabilis TaxID=574656 RepID=A0AAE0WL72_9PEZI|nr:hypothetical protein LTR78_006305 [Recurvomyces mirabilis]KAK5152194.1 hypothetical protein LTS14_008569 [Recurvomyces mirabilis]
MSSYIPEVASVFPDELVKRIHQTVAQNVKLQQLFLDIAVFVKTRQTQDGLPNDKKRKLEYDATVTTHTNGTTQNGLTEPTIAYECKDVSFQVPARKKLKLQVVADAQEASRQEIRMQNQQSNGIEYVLPSHSIEQAFCLPVPDKQQRQWNFVLFPKPGAITAEGLPSEQMVFAMNETKPVGATSAAQAPTEHDTFVTVTERELNRVLQPQGKHVVIPNPAEFASSIEQAHRKGEKAYHVKAFRGSKDGYLFFLSNGIVFGFKKPLAYFPFSAVNAISYQSVLQRTFNLVISIQEETSAEAKDIEFSMLDQADFAGIDEYIKRHGLNDASMADERRAKAYNVNKEKKRTDVDPDAPAVAGGEEQSELQKAEQQMQDEEDEEEEDYVASGGESEGEGDDSDEGEEYDEDGGQEEGMDEDMGEEDDAEGDEE